MENGGVSSNKRLVLNMTATFVSCLVTFGMSIFLSPYIVKSVGVDAYGFVGLANNFVNYASLSTIALNALAGRFITIKIYEGDQEGANRYFSSVFIANSVIASTLFLAFSVIWLFLDELINIPGTILIDVKILFAAVFLECVISTMGSVFSVATFATNRLYLNSIRAIESNIARIALLVLLFVFWAPNVCYIGITSVLVAVYCLLFNMHYTRRLLPGLKICNRYFDFGAIRELISSGVWALFTKLGQILSDGLDLLISNLLIDSVAMGVLSLAKTIPLMISGIVGNLVNVFSPRFTILYAQKRSEDLQREVKRAMKIMGIIVNLPIIVLVVCGKEFFLLWQPTQNAEQLQILSLLTCFGLVFSGGINCLYNLFVVVNKVRENAIAVVMGGIISVIVTYILLRTTNLGIFAIAATSTAVNVLRNIFFTATFGAKCLKQRWYTFFPEVFRPCIFDLFSIGASYLAIRMIPINGWLLLIAKAGIVAVISLVIGAFIILNRTDRDSLKELCWGVIAKKNGTKRGNE